LKVHFELKQKLHFFQFSATTAAFHIVVILLNSSDLKISKMLCFGFQLSWLHLS